MPDMDQVEERLSEAVSAAVRDFLSRLTDETISALQGDTSLVAAAVPQPLPNPREDLPMLGEVYGWWTDAVGNAVAPVLAEIFEEFWEDLEAGVGPAAIATSLDASEFYLGKVTDRLVRGITPPLPDRAFDTVRSTIAEGMTVGWSTSATSQHIAKRLGWEANGEYWRTQKGYYGSKIDGILDALGAPGNPAREWARRNDPRVQELRDRMNEATLRLDSERSYWEIRAERIARTESTAAYNYGALNSLALEGFTHKMWNSTYDSRTRPEHAALDGQVVSLNSQFMMDGYGLMFPGDPSAPASLVVNCRCFITGEDEGVESASAEELPYSGLEDENLLLALQEAEQYRENTLEDVLDTFTEAEELAQEVYVLNGYDPMNGILRGNQLTLDIFTGQELGDYSEQIGILQSAIASRKSDREMTLLRGVRNWDNSVAKTSGVSDFSKLKVGDFYSDPGFSSVTTNTRTATDFAYHGAMQGEEDSEGWIMVLKVPPGTPMLPGNIGESEIILNAGVKQQVTAVDSVKQIIYAKVLP